MKSKLIYTGIIAAIFIGAMIIFKNKIDLGEAVSILIGAAGSILAVWNWISKEEVKRDFKEVTNKTHKQWKLNKA